MTLTYTISLGLNGQVTSTGHLSKIIQLYTNELKVGKVFNMVDNSKRI